MVELLEGRLSSDLAHAWRWRPGGDPLKSRRAAPAQDLSDLPGWKHDDRPVEIERKLASVDRDMADLRIKAHM